MKKNFVYNTIKTSKLNQCWCLWLVMIHEYHLDKIALVLLSCNLFLGSHYGIILDFVILSLVSLLLAPPPSLSFPCQRLSPNLLIFCSFPETPFLHHCLIPAAPFCLAKISLPQISEDGQSVGPTHKLFFTEHLPHRFVIISLLAPWNYSFRFDKGLDILFYFL